MNERLTPAPLVFSDGGMLFSPRHHDVYHGAYGALAQARYVFLCGNALPERWRGQAHFTILENGFGIGVNFLATWAAWRDDTHRATRLEFVSIEKHPFGASDLRRAHDAVIDDPAIHALGRQLADAWPALEAGVHRLEFDAGGLALTLVFDDVSNALARLQAHDHTADAVYLDGFSPSKNPDMWTPDVFARIARLCHANATFATYSSSGDVKRALIASGFEYRKARGFSGKRAMLVGKRAGAVA